MCKAGNEQPPSIIVFSNLRMIRSLSAASICSILFGFLTALHAENSLFNTVRVEGESYVNLSDFTRYYHLTVASQQNLDLILSSKTRKMKLRINSRECTINGIRIWLNAAPIDYHNGILLPDVDVRKTIDPILRASSVARHEVHSVMIDPGHGGEDQGTLGYRKTQEKRFALDLAERVEEFLKKEGFKTLMTRRDDHFISLEDRSEMTNSSDADIFVSIHLNSASPNTQAHGIETYCLTPVGLSSTGSIRRRLGIGDFGEEPGNRYDSHNMLLAYLVQQSILKALPSTEDRGVKRARFFVIKATERPSILIENGFLSNPAEEKLIMSEAYREKLATAIAAGVKKFASIMNHD